MKWKSGSELFNEDKGHVLRSYVHRFTKEHIPRWAKLGKPNGEPYSVQFADDQDWLKNTTFACKADGSLDQRVKCCRSDPTWPEGMK